MKLAALLLAHLTKPSTLKFVSKLGSVWIVSFIAASGGIWARRWHRDPGEPRPQGLQRRRPWNGPTTRRR